MLFLKKKLGTWVVTNQDLKFLVQIHVQEVSRVKAVSV